MDKPAGRDFDKEAAAWDIPPRVKLSEDIAAAIRAHIPLDRNMHVLDFGCGTGLLSLALRPYVHSVAGIDSSRGMLDVFDHKVEAGGIGGIRTFCLDLTAGGSLPGTYDVIVANMTLHHIPEIKPLLDTFQRVLLPGGRLAISDLDPEGGLFHPDHAGVFHDGFERGELRKMLETAGFSGVRDWTAAEMSRPVAGGEMRTFSIFLMTGSKAA